jgi:hypothetical protein
MSAGESYDYAARGRDDFLAGKKDEVRYAMTDKTGEDYRRGYRLARLSAPGHCDDCAPDYTCWAHGFGCRKVPTPGPTIVAPPPKPASNDEVPDFIVEPVPLNTPEAVAARRADDENLREEVGPAEVDLGHRALAGDRFPREEAKKPEASARTEEVKPRKKRQKEEPADQLGLF